MIDIETLGNKAGCVVTSIAAVEFDINTGETGKEFYERIDIQSCLDLGLFVQGDTIKWWFDQTKEAQQELFKNTQHLVKVLYDFKMFIDGLKPANLKVWGNSNRFDLGILSKAYYAAGQKEIPWKYTLERDVRTLVSFLSKFKEDEVFTGVKHNPIDDCKHQIKYCTKIWKYYQIKENDEK